MARILKRSFGIIAFNAGQTVSLDLPRNHVFKSVYLRLTGSITKTGGTANGVVASEVPFSLIKAVAVVRNGSDVLQRADGGTLFALARINSDGDPQFTTNIVNTVTANQTFSADIPIDFASWRMANPSSTLLRGVGTSSLRLDVTWGNFSDLVSGSTDGTYSVGTTPIQIEVFTEEIMDLTGDFGDKLIVVTTRAIPANFTSNQFTIDLPVGPFYRRLILKTLAVSGTAALPVTFTDTLISQIRVISDGSFFHTDRLGWDVLRGMNKRNYAMPTLFSGYAVVDFCEDGNPGGLIDTRGASSFQVELNLPNVLAAVQQIQVIQEQIVPARVATAA